MSLTMAEPVGRAPAPRPYSMMSSTESPCSRTALKEPSTEASGLLLGMKAGCTRHSMPFSVFLPMPSSFKV